MRCKIEQQPWRGSKKDLRLIDRERQVELRADPSQMSALACDLLRDEAPVQRDWLCVMEDEAERRKLKDYLFDLKPPKGLGFIVRTAGAGRSRRELSRDLAYLLRLWKAIFVLLRLY